MLSRMMLRNTATQALLELETDGSYPTLAGPNIFDSRIFPAELDDERQEIPVCAVYTDKQTFSDKPRDPQTSISNVVHEVKLCFEICVAENGAPTFENGKIISRAPMAMIQTDAELEACLDIFEAQILWTLQNPSKKWSVAFGNLCREITTYESSREADGSKNLKLAFRKIELGCIICPDPVPFIIPSDDVKCITTKVCEVIPKTGTYLDDMLEGLAANVANDRGNLSTAISIMTSTFGGGGGILWPALRRVGVTVKVDDPDARDGKLIAADAVLKIGG